MKQNAAVIVAAGRGSRIGPQYGPKQYLPIGENSVLQHTVNAFVNHENINVVQVVIHKDDLDLFVQHVKPHPKLLEPVFGGKTRQESCKAGIDAVEAYEKVLVHDAARPFVSHRTIDNVLDGISPSQCALPATAIADTVKKQDASTGKLMTIPREGMYLAQTPQGFVTSEIATAHAKAAIETGQEFTDDAAVAEWAGIAVQIVDGNRDNFKITTSEDLIAAREKVLMQNTPDVRTGHGYDTHTLGPGSSVILCGIEIEHTKSLQGHSDADVGLHALTDALLGTIGSGDIGSHFPPTDDQWKGAASDQFLRHAVELVRTQNGKVTHLDVTVICEAPKIGPHRNQMRTRIAEICALEVDRVSVKATTNEKVGFIGRQEAIAAIATATVVF